MHASQPQSDDTLELRICPDCDAAVHADDAKCWLCGRVQPGIQTASQPSEPQYVPAELVRHGGPGGYQFTLTGVLLVAALAVVNVGVFLIEPGSGIGMAILFVPAALITLIRAARRRGQGAPLTVAQRFLTFLASFAATMGVFVLLAFAMFVALFVFCLIAMSGSNF